MDIAAWHWNDTHSTHVVMTSHTLPHEKRVYAAITRCINSTDIAVMTDSCTKASEDHPATGLPDIHRGTSRRGTITFYTMPADISHIPDAVEHTAQAAAQAAAAACVPA